MGTLVFTVNATDRDEGTNAGIDFSLDDRSSALPFEIVGRAIVVSGSLDFEQRIIYSVSQLIAAAILWLV